MSFLAMVVVCGNLFWYQREARAKKDSYLALWSINDINDFECISSPDIDDFLIRFSFCKKKLAKKQKQICLLIKIYSAFDEAFLKCCDVSY